MAALGKVDEAESAPPGKAVAIQQQLAEEFPDVPEYRGELARSHDALGLLLYDLGRHEEAEAAFRTGLKIYEQPLPILRRSRGESQRFGHVPQPTWALGSLSVGKYAEAEKSLRAAQRLYVQLVADLPNEPLYRNNIAANHLNLLRLPESQLKATDAWAESAAQTIYRQLVERFSGSASLPP